MSSGFGDLTVQAHHLVSAGDLAGAQRLLADALTDADPRPANASPELADAAGLQARVLVALGEPHSARGWAAFAYAAATRLYGRADERTITAAATLAAVLHRVGSDARAARLYSDVIIELTARDGPESMRVLAAHADLATVEYARGQCEVARDRLQDAWELHREVYGDDHPSGIKMLAKLGAMERDCGRYADSHEHLTLAEELCRVHLAADDPLAAQVAALSRAARPGPRLAAPAPAAGQRPSAGRPGDAVVPAARVPPAAEGPPEPPPYQPPEQPLYHPPDRAAAAPHPTVPTPRLPPEAGPDPFGEPSTDDDWWPPEEHLDELYRAGQARCPRRWSVSPTASRTASAGSPGPPSRNRRRHTCRCTCPGSPRPSHAPPAGYRRRCRRGRGAARRRGGHRRECPEWTADATPHLPRRPPPAPRPAAPAPTTATPRAAPPASPAPHPARYG